MLDKIKDVLNEIKWFIQRGKRGWADCDAWGYFAYNARVNYEALKWLHVHKHGTPCNMFEINEPRNPTPEEETKAVVKWESILNDMIFAFDQINQCEDNVIYWHEGRNDRDWEDFSCKYPDTKLQTKEEHDRMLKGMHLFIKHYWSLWD